MVVDKTNKKSVISYYVPKHKQYLQGLDQKPWVRSLFFHCISLCCRNNKKHSSCLCNAKYRFLKIEGKSCSSKCTNKEKSILFVIGQTPRPKCDNASIQTHWTQLWGNLANNKNTSNQHSHFTQDELLNFFFSCTRIVCALSLWMFCCGSKLETKLFQTGQSQSMKRVQYGQVRTILRPLVGSFMAQAREIVVCPKISSLPLLEDRCWYHLSGCLIVELWRH